MSDGCTLVHVIVLEALTLVCELMYSIVYQNYSVNLTILGMLVCYKF